MITNVVKLLSSFEDKNMRTITATSNSILTLLISYDNFYHPSDYECREVICYHLKRGEKQQTATK